MNAAKYLLAAGRPSDLALLAAEGSYTYTELIKAVDAGARWLARRGHEKGDRVLVLADNSFFWVVSYFSALRAGLVAVPLSGTISPADLEYIIADTAPVLGFVQASYAGRYREQLSGIPFVDDTNVPSSFSQDAADPAETSGEDLASLIYTSGSTGKPRGVMVSHLNIIANTDSIIAALSLSARDRIMDVLPFHYCFGLSLLHTHLCVGGSIVIDRRFMFPEAVLQRMRETRCTGFAGVPSHYQILLRKSGMRKMSFPDLRYVQQAGGHLAPIFVRELREALPQTQIFIMYGQTEATARLTILPADMLASKPGSIGKPIPGVRISLVDETGRTVPRGEVGEIVAEGENVACGYWRQAGESAKTFRDGRLYTGDLARMDQDGYLYLVGRTKEFLKLGGKRISCQQLEDTLLEYEAILEVAIVGMQDEILGETSRVFVVPRPGEVDGLEGRVRAYCKRSLPHMFRPKEIMIVPSLPKSTSGKVLKWALPPMAHT